MIYKYDSEKNFLYIKGGSIEMYQYKDSFSNTPFLSEQDGLKWLKKFFNKEIIFKQDDDKVFLDNLQIIDNDISFNIYIYNNENNKISNIIEGVSNLKEAMSFEKVSKGLKSGTYYIDIEAINQNILVALDINQTTFTI